MKRKSFFKAVIIYLAVLILIFISLDFLSTVDALRSYFAKVTDSEDYLEKNGPNDVIPHINKAGSNSESTILIIGDSICRQIFNELNVSDEKLCIVPLNAAVTLPGQYLIAEEYLDTHAGATDIYMFMHPHSLLHSYSTPLEYQYAVMPFVETGSLTKLDESTIDCIATAYGSFSMSDFFVKMVDNSPINRKLYLNYLEKHGCGYEEKRLFEFTDTYIPRLYNQCEERGVTLHLYSTPVTDYFSEDMKVKREAYLETETYKLFPDYFEDIVYVPEEYTEDKAHFDEEHKDIDYFKSLMKSILKEDSLSNIF